jgi:subtilisin family serine protease
MRPLLFAWLSAWLFVTASLLADDDDREELIIRAQSQAVQGIADRYGLTLLRSFDQANQNLFLLLCPREDEDDEDEFECDDDLIERIAADPEVENVAENEDLEVPELPGTGADEDDVAGSVDDDTVQNYFGTTVWTQFASQPAGTIIGTARAHTVATGASVVAIIDTGADFNHPVLQPALIPGFDFFTNTVTTTSELADLDPETAAILDQSTSAILEQEDVVIVNQSTSAILEQDAANQLDPGRLPAAFGHGTMVAGLVRLVAPTATIMPLKAFRPDGTSTTFEILRAIYYATDNGADVINMSFSLATANSELKRAIDYATSRGVVAVASAGNTGNRVVVYPAAWPNVIGVASTTAQDTRSSFSNYGADLVTLAAPGEALLTTYPGGNYAGVWGTSFSAALVSGAVALLRQIDPGLDQADAHTSLSQAEPIDHELGAGRLDLQRALDAIASSGGDADADGLPDAWERQFGLDAESPDGPNGWVGDPDGDGLANAIELSEGTHPRGFFTFHVAEEKTAPARRRVIVLTNSTTSLSTVLLHFVKDDTTAIRQYVALPAGTRQSVDPQRLAGLAGARFSTVIESDLRIRVRVKRP